VDELLPQLRVDVTHPVDLKDLFPQARELWLEIGFGGGEHLLQRAAEHLDIGFVGCEPFVNGVAKALAGIDGQALSNIRLLDGDAGLLIDQLPDQASIGFICFIPILGPNGVSASVVLSRTTCSNGWRVF